MESKKTTIKALVLGGTGEVGRKLVDLLVKSPYYSEVCCIVRRKLDIWEKYEESEKLKLRIVNQPDLEILGEDKDKIITTLKNDFRYDTLFCCLGADPTKDEATFIKVDLDYVVMTAAFAEKFSIPHFSLVSSNKADPNSWFTYLKIKGQADAEVLKKNIKRISIFRPPLIADREDARCGEKFLRMVPFYKKIKTIDIAEGMKNEDLKYHLTDDQSDIRNAAQIHEYAEIMNFKNEKLNI
jgi:hypothetical protein